MDIFLRTLEAMEYELSELQEAQRAELIKKCIYNRQNDGTVDGFLRLFSPSGELSGFSFSKKKLGVVRCYYANQLFGALVSMATQTAVFEKQGREMTMDFIYRYFGRPTETLGGSKCADCNAVNISLLNIHEIIAPKIISVRVIEGLEENKLIEKITPVMTMQAPELQREEMPVRRMLKNSGIDGLYITEKETDTSCSKCGCNRLSPCRLIKSVRNNKFILLGAAKQ